MLKFNSKMRLSLEETMPKIREGKTLVYFASGNKVKPEYYKLPFDNIILVDKCFSETKFRENVLTVKADAIGAVYLLKSQGIKIDAFVCINEGLIEGGGDYSLNSNCFVGLVLPLLQEEYIHISCPAYYGKNRWKKYVNIPYSRETLAATDADYINPDIFSDSWGKSSIVEKRKRIEPSGKTLRINNIELKIQRKSIWEDYETLDRLFIRCTAGERENLCYLFPKASTLNSSFDEILEDQVFSENKQIGFVPWRRGKYKDLIEVMNDYNGKQLTINFYHLNRNDYRELYEISSL